MRVNRRWQAKRRMAVVDAPDNVACDFLGSRYGQLHKPFDKTAHVGVIWRIIPAVLAGFPGPLAPKHAIE